MQVPANKDDQLVGWHIECVLFVYVCVFMYVCMHRVCALVSNIYIRTVESVITITMDTLHRWSDTTNQPISLVASCYALEQLKLVSKHNDDDIANDGCFFTTAQQKVCNAEGKSFVWAN